jgi:hypothetical protein
MKKFLVLAIISLILPLGVSAYYESPSAGDLRTSIYPQNPGTSQKTSLSLASYLLKLDTCEIIWSQDKKIASQGIGQKSFSFTTGQLGQIVSISAILNCPNRDQIKKDWLFQTNEVEFLIAADTYVPPFYRGGNRISSKSSVKIVAMPQVFTSTGDLMKAENLIYRWTKNGKAMPISSGYGKNTITVQASEIPGTTNYAVEISSLAGEIKTTKTINITTEDPQIILYENKPLLGIQSQKGLRSLLNLTDSETTLTAEPFFFANSDLAGGNLTFSWQMNNKAISPSTDSRSVTLRQEAGQSGEAIISLRVANATNLFSGAEQTLKVNFGQKSLLGF